MATIIVMPGAAAAPVRQEGHSGRLPRGVPSLARARGRRVIESHDAATQPPETPVPLDRLATIEAKVCAAEGALRVLDVVLKDLRALSGCGSQEP